MRCFLGLLSASSLGIDLERDGTRAPERLGGVSQAIPSATQSRYTVALRQCLEGADAVGTSESTTGFMLKSIEGLRQRLLDLTKRNPLLSFKHRTRSRRYIRVVDELPDELYKRLTDPGKRMRFKGLRDLSEDPAEEQTIEFRRTLDQARIEDNEYRDKVDELGEDANERELHRLEVELRNRVRHRLGLPPRLDTVQAPPTQVAKSMGVNPSFDLPREHGGEGNERHHDAFIQTLLFREAMNRTLSGMNDQVRLTLNETGVNTLFCAFGFLEWFEDDNSDTALHAPLVLCPLEIEKQLVRQKWQFSVASTGDRALANLSLAVRLKRDFGLQLPEFEEDDTPEAYFAKVGNLVNDRKGWRVRRWVTVGLFSFAKIAMYEDLDPKSWPRSERLEEHGGLTRLLRGDEESGEGVVSAAENKESGVEPSSQTEPLIIHDADSSQIDAIRDALEGRDLVIDGPPGTGKSQTITNLIAAALDQGKSVLFVAEKMAALEVVFNRLKEAGLDRFCLELHSMKASRQRVVEAIAKRLGTRPVRGVHRELEQSIEETSKLKRRLGRYVTAMNTPLGELKLSVHEILWRCQRLRQEHPEIRAEIDQITLSNADEITEMEAGSIYENLKTLVELRSSVARQFGTVRSCPWFGLGGPHLNVFSAHSLVRRLKELCQALARLVACEAALAELMGLRIRESIEGIMKLSRRIEGLPEMEDGALHEILPRLGQRNDRERLAQFCLNCRSIRSARERIEARVQPGVDVASLDEQIAADVARRVVAAKLEQVQVSELPAVLEKQVNLAAQAGQLLRLGLEIKKRFEANGEVVGVPLPALIRAVELAESAPREVVDGRCKGLLERGGLDVVKRAVGDWKHLRDQRQRIERSLRIPTERSPDDLLKHAGVLRNAPFIPWFSRSYWAAMREYRSLEINRENVPMSTTAQRLEELGAYLRGCHSFERNSEYARVLGQHFDGVNTNLRYVVAITEWAQKVREQLAGYSEAGIVVRSVLFECSADEFELIQGLAQDSHFETLRDASADGIDLQSLEERRNESDDAAVRLRELTGRVSELRCREQCVLGACGELADAIASWREMRDAVREARAVAETLGDKFGGENTCLEPVEKACRYAERIVEANLPEEISRWLLTTDHEKRMNELKEWCCKTADACEVVESTMRAILEEVPFELKPWLGVESIVERPAAELKAFLERCLDVPEALIEIVEDQRCESELREQGIGPLLEKYEELGAPLAKLPHAFMRVLYVSLARSAVSKNSELAAFGGTSHEAARKRYQELDRKLLTLSRAKLADELARRPIAPGNGSGPKYTWTDRALVEHLVTLQRPRTSVREILDRAGTAIQQMMPCFMMSPLSVAQSLKPGGLRFDLVIMDEASQLRPEDALGAIGRGAQVVVVGDLMQLPPTSFFDAGGLPSEDEDDSILKRARAILRPSKRLKWHYRSRHPSLIRYSNHEFYDDELVLFPSPFDDHESYGVRLEEVPGGRYSGSVNVKEVQYVAEEALKFMRQHPDRSLGIVTMNRPQRDLLQIEMDRIVAENPEADEYCRIWGDHIESFFVKNLENVQGDERDTIMISTVYGRSVDHEKLHQRFGPVNGPVGHRRLNVLFTRAKYQTIVYTSMDPDEIRVEESSARGLKVFKEYLTFAKSGRLSRPVYTGREPDSEFERAVATVLRQHGYEVVPQLGVSGYFIDVAVRHPARAGTFVLGIECDGASYHSAKAARDRDRLRQEILERLGWNIHRIWSLDWFGNPKREEEKLVAKLKKLAVVSDGTTEQ